jgi:hypothetical protein
MKQLVPTVLRGNARWDAPASWTAFVVGSLPRPGASTTAFPRRTVGTSRMTFLIIRVESVLHPWLMGRAHRRKRLKSP